MTLSCIVLYSISRKKCCRSNHRVSDHHANTTYKNIYTYYIYTCRSHTALSLQRPFCSYYSLPFRFLTAVSLHFVAMTCSTFPLSLQCRCSYSGMRIAVTEQSWTTNTNNKRYRWFYLYHYSHR